MKFIQLLSSWHFAFSLYCFAYMSSSGGASSVDHFNSKGRLEALESAKLTMSVGGPIIGIRCPDGIILATARKAISKLVVTPPSKLFQIHRDMYLAATGLLPDAIIIVKNARMLCEKYHNAFGEPITAQLLASQLSAFMYRNAVAGSRPFGVGLIIVALVPPSAIRGSYVTETATAPSELCTSEVYGVEPDGTFLSRKNVCLGHDASYIQQKLGELLVSCEGLPKENTSAGAGVAVDRSTSELMPSASTVQRPIFVRQCLTRVVKPLLQDWITRTAGVGDGASDSPPRFELDSWRRLNPPTVLRKPEVAPHEGHPPDDEGGMDISGRCPWELDILIGECVSTDHKYNGAVNPYNSIDRHVLPSSDLHHDTISDEPGMFWFTDLSAQHSDAVGGGDEVLRPQPRDTSPFRFTRYAHRHITSWLKP